MLLGCMLLGGMLPDRDAKSRTVQFDIFNSILKEVLVAGKGDPFRRLIRYSTAIGSSSSMTKVFV